MCGIAGILRVYPPGSTPPPHFESIPESWLDLLDDSIKHRGPDGQGRFRDRVTRSDGCTVDVALVHRRLSILDHKGGAQPMVSHSPSFQEGAGGRFFDATKVEQASGIAPSLPLLFHGSPTDAVRYEPIVAAGSILGTPTLRVGSSLSSSLPRSDNLLAVTFNGCIYNHRELRKELEAKGHRFVTDHSDTEVLLHGWREWQENLPKHTDGMFSYMIWDRARASLFGARDLCGEKPLFQLSSTDRNISAIGSSYPGLVRLALEMETKGHATSIAPDEMAETIALGYGTPKLSHGLSRLGALDHAGDTVVGADSPRVIASVGGWSDLRTRSSRYSLNPSTLDTLLRSAVCSRLEADVPMGVFLSGGIDSALVAAYIRQERADVPTFTVRIPDSRFDESQAAQTTARKLGLEHHILDCEHAPADDLVRLVEQIGLPFGDSSLIPSFWICRAVRRTCTVALTGDGADELFCGYERYRGDYFCRTFRPFLRHFPASLLNASRSHGWSDKLRRLVDAARGFGYADLVSLFPSSMMRQLTGNAAYPMSLAIWNADDAPHLDFNTYLPGDILTKSDSASMSVALELRSPFLAKSIIDAALATPLSTLMPRGQRKGLLRAVARQYLPKEIVDRPKMGFAIPVGEWFRSDFGKMKTLLFDMLNSVDPFPADLLGLELNRKFIDQMVSEHMESRRDHSQRLYMLLVLAIWCRWLRRLRSGGAQGTSSVGT